MSDAVRCWLVEREYDQRDLVTLTYATPAGDRAYTRRAAAASLRRRGGVTAAVDVEPGDLAPVEDAATRERYAAEAERVAARNDPDEPI